MTREGGCWGSWTKEFGRKTLAPDRERDTCAFYFSDVFLKMRWLGLAVSAAERGNRGQFKVKC
jgi:hypothetical protein